jgi:hypothetical protein
MMYILIWMHQCRDVFFSVVLHLQTSANAKLTDDAGRARNNRMGTCG